jgi:hypothetical protein
MPLLFNLNGFKVKIFPFSGDHYIRQAEDGFGGDPRPANKL